MRLTSFAGLLPKVNNRSLPDSGATTAINMDVYGNLIRPLPMPASTNKVVDVRGFPMDGKTMSVYECSGVSIGWEEVTNVVPDPSKRLGNDSFMFVEDGLLKRQSVSRVLRHLEPMLVGIKRPDATPSATVSGGGCASIEVPQVCMPSQTSDCDEAAYPPEITAYVFTYVNGCQEESAPSMPTNEVDVARGDGVTITFNDTPPSNAEVRRIYRYVASSDGSTVALNVGQCLIGASSWTDTSCDNDFGEALRTTYHDAPPDCLEGVTIVGDDIAVLWSNRHIYLSERREIHAYNIKNEWRLRFNIIQAMATTSIIESGDTYHIIVVCDGLNYIISANDPNTTSIAEVQSRYQAYSKKSIAQTEDGVFFACRQGICAFNAKGIQLITGNWVTENEWGRYNPSELRLCYGDHRLLSFTDKGKQMLLQLGSDKRREPSFTEHTMDFDMMYSNYWAQEKFVKTSNLYEFTTSVGNYTYTWRSKTFTQDGEWRPTYLKVISEDFVQMKPSDEKAVRAFASWMRERPESTAFEFIENHPEYSAWYANLLPDKPSVHVTIFADGEVYHEQIVDSNRPIQIPRGYKALEWQVQVRGRVPVEEIHLQGGRESLAGGR